MLGIKSLSTSPSATAGVESNSASKPAASKNASLFVSVCVERMPVITGEMDELEKRYSNLINEINVKKSVLSNHELRHLKDLLVLIRFFLEIYFRSINSIFKIFHFAEKKVPSAKKRITWTPKTS